MIWGLLAFFALFVAFAFLIVRTVAEIRSRRYWWAAAALVGAVGIATAPYPKQIINITIPSN